MDRVVRNACPHFSQEDKREILLRFRDVLDGMLTLGPVLPEFEREFAEYVGCKHAVAVHSGTCAMEIVLRYFELKGREVVLPALTYVASANAVVIAGGRPVFSDIDPESLCISLETIKTKISSDTVGVMVVPMLGQIPPDLDRIRAYCRGNDLFLIEDCAHSHGAEYHGVRSGALTDAGCFSFFSTKIMTSGEGGMITTDHDGIADFARSFRHHGTDGSRETCIRPGSNHRMDEFRAIVGQAQLRRLEEAVVRRNEIADYYRNCLRDESQAGCLPKYEAIRHSYWKFPVGLDRSIDVGKLTKLCAVRGVYLSAPYQPLPVLHPFYRKTYGYKVGDFPSAEDIVSHYTTLPMHLEISEEDASYVVDVFLDGISKV